ncbi:MAG: PAS domain S-box protein [Verrucomicrobiae bacterium]|nr:PAS domain S-box protein [Verrucomicrobiae bacterium]
MIATVIDITERKQSEEQLKRNEELLAEAQTVAHLGSWEWDPVSNELTGSKEFYRVFRSDAESFRTFNDYFSYVPEEERRGLIDLFKRGFSQGKPIKKEHTILVKKRRKRYVEFRAFFQKRNEQVARVYGTILDITALRSRDEELEKLSLVASKTNNAVVITDSQGRAEWVNEGFTKLTGYNFYELIGHKPGPFLQGPETDLSTVARISTKLKAGRSFTEDILNYHKKGSSYWISLSVTPILNEAGEVEKFIGISQDITARKEAEKVKLEFTEKLEQEVKERTSALKEREEKYRLISENMSDLICQMSEGNVFSFVSPSSLDLLGYAPEELLGKSFLDLAATGFHEVVEEGFRRATQSRIPVKLDFKVKRKDGEEVWIETAVKPVLNAQGQTILIQTSSRNIDERKRAVEDIRRTLEKERELGELKSRFVSMASHQFRTPLTVIQSNIELLELQKEILDERVQPKLEKVLTRIRFEVNRLTDLMNDVLILGKMNAGKVQADLNPLELDHFVGHLVEEFAQANSTRAKPLLHIEGSPYPLLLDDKVLAHALHNLLSNAFKYSEGRPLPEVLLRYEPSRVLLQVKDHGIGIPEEDPVGVLGARLERTGCAKNPLDHLGLIERSRDTSELLAQRSFERRGGDERLAIGSAQSVITPLARSAAAEQQPATKLNDQTMGHGAASTKSRISAASRKSVAIPFLPSSPATLCHNKPSTSASSHFMCLRKLVQPRTSSSLARACW